MNYFDKKFSYCSSYWWKRKNRKRYRTFKEGNGKFLLISGVFQKEKVKNKYLFKDNINLKECCIFFEEKAKNTFQNATEVSNWLKERKVNIDSIQLITSYYHIPRSLIIFKKFFPNKKLITVPVSQFSFSKELFFHIRLIFQNTLKFFIHLFIYYEFFSLINFLFCFLFVDILLFCFFFTSKIFF